ncbi:NUDIX hydrolase [Nocardia sp. NPDC051052]|uniref:NUDIX hydrolase n=1 Tax=Nocardia sp. NPDC051052 TaxID=3364322 RepID=UPI003797D692
MEPTAEQVEPVARTSVRLLLVDDKDRLLLFASHDDSDGHRYWYPIGGGIEEGETLAETAVREAWEETGLIDFQLGPEVWRRRATASWGDVMYDCREHYFLVRVDSFDVDTSGFTENERETVTGHHWWTLDEMSATGDRLVPRDLRSLLSDLLVSGPPDELIFLTT